MIAIRFGERTLTVEVLSVAWRLLSKKGRGGGPHPYAQSFSGRAQDWAITSLRALPGLNTGTNVGKAAAAALYREVRP